MPMVGFGTWQLGGRRGCEATRYALDIGYRQIDTATMYRDEHEEVGQAIRDSGLDRGEVFVTTELQPSNAGRAPHPRRTPARSRRPRTPACPPRAPRSWPTAYTIPGLSGQDAVSTYSHPRIADPTAAANVAQYAMRISICNTYASSDPQS
jgi:Aldo/keto reductase family